MKSRRENDVGFPAKKLAEAKKMNTKKLKWFGIILIVLTGTIHFMESPEYFDEAAYMGILFVLNGLGSIAAAYGIFKNKGWGWFLGFFIAFGSIIGYIVSRTAGLPSVAVKNWFELTGILSLIVEALFIVVLLAFFNGKIDVPRNLD